MPTRVHPTRPGDPGRVGPFLIIGRLGDYVFTTRIGRMIEPMNLSRSFQRITEPTGLPRIRLHDARHGCATLLFAAGVPARVVMEILGHSQLAVTMNIWPHVSETHRREAMGHMDRLLQRRRQ